MRPVPNGILPLEAGDHLSRAEFERRYKAMPHVKKAELVEGVVYMPSPARHQQHARPTRSQSVGCLLMLQELQERTSPTTELCG